VKTADEGSILHLPLKSSGVSEVFEKAAESNGYHTISEVLSIPLTELIKTNWITRAMWSELMIIIEKFPPPKDID
jgi:hypothetical protein